MGINKRYIYVSEDSLSAHKDALRVALGSLWAAKKEGDTGRITFGRPVVEKLFKIEYGPVMVSEGAKPPFSAKHQIVKLVANPKKYGVYPECLECGWSDFTKSITKDFHWARGKDPQTALSIYNEKPSHYNTYKDCVFSIETPLSKEEAAFSGTQSKYMAGNVDFEYDYYLEEYETALDVLKLEELSLPNLYLLLNNEDDAAFITRLRDNGTCRAKEYISLLGTAYDTLLIPNRVARSMSAINTFKEFVPFQAEVSFTTDQVTATADSLRDSNTECNLMRRLSEHPEDTKRKFTIGHEIFAQQAGRRYKKTKVTESNIKSYDLFAWMEGMKNSMHPAAITEKLPEGHIFIGPDNDSTMMALSGTKNGFRKMMAFLILSGRIKDLLSTSNRSIQELLLGAESHSETLLYKIEKHNTVMYDLYEKALSDDGLEIVAVESEDSESTGSTAIDYAAISEAVSDMISESPPTPIQTMWVANSSDIDIFDYVDTQVKYGEDYTYTVTAYQMVVGTDYFYSSIPAGCEGWEVPLGNVSPSQIEFISETIGSSESMHNAYNNIVAYLGSIGYVSAAGVILPEYCGGDLHIATNSDRQRILVCSCGDENLNNRNKCLEDLCKRFKQIRNQISDERLSSDELETKISDSIQHLGGRTPSKIYKDLLRSEYSSQSAISIMKKILLNSLNYILNYEVGGLNISASDVNGNLEYSVVRDWQFSRQEDAIPRSGKLTSVVEGAQSYMGENPPNKSKGIRNVLKYDFDTNRNCPQMIDPCEYIFTATTIPNAMIYEIPYFIHAGTMIDSPPVTPGLEIVPYRNVNDKLLFNFNTGIGDYYDKPIVIRQSDKEQFIKVMRAQGSGTTKKIRFKADDPAHAFQIFRSDKAPTRYTDFSDKLVKTIFTDVDSNTIQKADSASHIEQIKPNKKYYYTFRTVDIHGHISNPTPIYEVELVDDDGAVYPIIDIVDIKSYTPDDNILSKKMMKLMQIVPTISQAMVNEERSNLEDATTAMHSGKDISLGMKRQSVWGKRFKIRLVSRKTGRKIDLNVNFKTKHVENPDAACMLETAGAITEAAAVTTTAATVSSPSTAGTDSTMTAADTSAPATGPSRPMSMTSTRAPSGDY